MCLEGLPPYSYELEFACVTVYTSHTIVDIYRFYRGSIEVYRRCKWDHGGVGTFLSTLSIAVYADNV